MQFEGKTVLVTGASRGIGNAIATKLGEEGGYILGTATTQRVPVKINAWFVSWGSKARA